MHPDSSVLRCCKLLQRKRRAGVCSHRNVNQLHAAGAAAVDAQVAPPVWPPRTRQSDLQQQDRMQGADCCGDAKQCKRGCVRSGGLPASVVAEQSARAAAPGAHGRRALDHPPAGPPEAHRRPLPPVQPACRFPRSQNQPATSPGPRLPREGGGLGCHQRLRLFRCGHPGVAASWHCCWGGSPGSHPANRCGGAAPKSPSPTVCPAGCAAVVPAHLSAAAAAAGDRAAAAAATGQDVLRPSRPPGRGVRGRRPGGCRPLLRSLGCPRKPGQTPCPPALAAQHARDHYHTGDHRATHRLSTAAE